MFEKILNDYKEAMKIKVSIIKWIQIALLGISVSIIVLSSFFSNNNIALFAIFTTVILLVWMYIGINHNGKKEKIKNSAEKIAERYKKIKSFLICNKIGDEKYCVWLISSCSDRLKDKPTTKQYFHSFLCSVIIPVFMVIVGTMYNNFYTEESIFTWLGCMIACILLLYFFSASLDSILEDTINKKYFTIRKFKEDLEIYMLMKQQVTNITLRLEEYIDKSKSNEVQFLFEGIKELKDITEDTEICFQLEDENFNVKVKEKLYFYRVAGSKGSEMVLIIPPIAEESIIFITKFVYE